MPMVRQQAAEVKAYDPFSKPVWIGCELGKIPVPPSERTTEYPLPQNGL